MASGTIARVGSRRSLANEARVEARNLSSALGREIRIARCAAGTSQRETGTRVSMSHSEWSRIERGILEQLTIDQLCRASRAVGLRALIRLVPDADPALDSAQLALLARLRGILPPGVVLRTEVPLPLAGDRRAWDGVLDLDSHVAVEAESRLTDAQALERRLALKQRDGRMEILILLVADTRSNREFLELHRESLRSRFPLDSRAILAALRAGRAPPASGIVVL